MKIISQLLGAALILSGNSVRAAVVSVSPEEASSLARQVYELFERRCAECHDEAGHHASKGGFGTVLDFAAWHKPRYLNFTAPERSMLYARLTDPDPDVRMPKLSKSEKGQAEPTPLTDREKEAVLKWITASAPVYASTPRKPEGNPPEPTPAPPVETIAHRKVIRESDAMVEVQRDLLAQPAAERARVRYLSLLPQHNNLSEVSDAQLATMRLGVRKLLNSLSTNPKLALPEEIGPGKAFYRFKLDDLGWDAGLWERIISFYPYAFRDSDLGRAAGTSVPVLRADWLATFGTRAPLYDEILRLPKDLDGLAQWLGVPLLANLRAGKALRVGITVSGISRFERLLERHDLGAWAGYLWVSYDFGSAAGTRDLLRFPLGPELAQLAGGRRAFQHDGGEMVFSLPNGFQGYFITDGKGRRLEVAPITIVGDNRGVTGRLDVITGFSCIVCHSSGIKEQPGSPSSIVDQVRVLAGRGQFSAEEEEGILTLYPEQSKIDAACTADRETFRGALAKAGVVQGAVEPVSSLALPFEERLTLARAAAELGLPLADLETALTERDDFGIVRIALAQGALPRESFSSTFADLAQRLRIGTIIAANAQPQGAADQLQAAQEKKRVHPLLFEMETNKLFYRAGEPLEIKLLSEKEGHLRLYYKDAAGKVELLFPTDELRQQATREGKPLNDLISGRNKVVVSGQGSVTHMTVRIRGPRFGREQLGAIVTDFPLADDTEVVAAIEKSDSMEYALSATATLAAKSAKAQLNDEPTKAERPRIGVQIIDLQTSP